MGRIPLVVAALVIAVVGAACGGSESGETTTTTSPLQDRFTDALSAQLTPKMPGVPGMGRCWAEAWVSTIGTERLTAAGHTPDTISSDDVERIIEELPRHDQIITVHATSRCALMFTAEQLRLLGISEGSITCFVDDYWTWLDDEVVALLERGEIPLWYTDEEALDDLTNDMMRNCLTEEELAAVRSAGSLQAAGATQTP